MWKSSDVKQICCQLRHGNANLAVAWRSDLASCDATKLLGGYLFSLIYFPPILLYTSMPVTTDAHTHRTDDIIKSEKLVRLIGLNPRIWHSAQWSILGCMGVWQFISLEYSVPRHHPELAGIAFLNTFLTMNKLAWQFYLQIRVLRYHLTTVSGFVRVLRMSCS
jgi:hypothetical protein